jgi:hypothetical protein
MKCPYSIIAPLPDFPDLGVYAPRFCAQQFERSRIGCAKMC